ncbi:MAG: acyl-CoA dehydrogenase, partial [Alphaproteobacteria bacterium]|nr:acyl-CoA dehydrogenase [Alphaproteobacteria bacterium]
MRGASSMALDFSLSDSQVILRSLARAFCTRELTPSFLKELDESGRAPGELLPKLAAEGFTGLPIPKEYGGQGGSATDVVVLLEEFGRASLGIASFLNRAFGWGAETLQKFGTEEQKRRYLPRVPAGEMIFAFSHTEPGAGSDAAAIRTRATADGDHFIINGAKIFTTGAAECPLLTVSARTDPATSPDHAKHKGLTMFLVEGSTPGVTYRKIEKLGMRGAGGLYEVEYHDVRVPRSAVLGAVNGGWQVITSTLERARIAQAAYCVGAAQRALDDLGSENSLLKLLARTATARLLLYRAAFLLDEGTPCA